jgi:hypothetical protein
VKILYIGDSKSITKNLLELGAEVMSWKDFANQIIDGIIITENLSVDELVKLRELCVPIILNSGKVECQKDVNVLILNEEQMNEFCGTTKWDISLCRDKIRKLGIKHLVVSLKKKEVKEFVKLYGLSTINRDMKVTDEDVERAEDVIIAIIGYLYVKDRILLPDSIERAKIGAILEVFGKENDSYHLKFSLKK